MSGQDQVRPTGDPQVGPWVHARCDQLVDFAFENDGVDHHAVAHEVQRVGAEDTGGDGVEDVLLAVEDERVPGVGTALEAGDDVILWRQNVHDFPLPFIAPLEAEQNINFHCEIVSPPERRLGLQNWDIISELNPAGGEDLEAAEFCFLESGRDASGTNQ